MPRPKSESNPLVVLIWGEAEAQGVTAAKLAEYAKCTRQTVYQIKKKPEKHFDKILRIGRCMGIPIDSLRAAVRYPW